MVGEGIRSRGAVYSPSTLHPTAREGYLHEVVLSRRETDEITNKDAQEKYRYQCAIFLNQKPTAK